MKPSVATNAVRATVPSSSALVATVMPWAKPSTSLARAPAASSARSTAAMTPRDWSSGVVGALAVCTTPVGDQDGVREGAAHVDAQEHPRTLDDARPGARPSAFRGYAASGSTTASAAISSISSVSARC